MQDLPQARLRQFSARFWLFREDSMFRRANSLSALSPWSRAWSFYLCSSGFGFFSSIILRLFRSSLLRSTSCAVVLTRISSFPTSHFTHLYFRESLLDASDTSSESVSQDGKSRSFTFDMPPAVFTPNRLQCMPQLGDPKFLGLLYLLIMFVALRVFAHVQFHQRASAHWHSARNR